MNRPEYIFRFYGGEPTIHPYFFNLWDYIFSSGRNVRCILHTNGLRSSSYFKKILGLAKNNLHLEVTVYPSVSSMKRLSNLLKLASKFGTTANIILYYNAQYDQIARNMANYLANLPPEMLFTFQLFSLDQENISCQKELESAVKAMRSMLQPPDWARLQSSDVVKGNFFCHGFNGAHVNKDGNLTLGLQNLDMPYELLISSEGKLKAGMPVAPGFETMDEARKELEKYQIASFGCRINMGPMKKYSQQGIEPLQLLQTRIAEIKPFFQPGVKAAPHFWFERQADIKKILDSLQDEFSKTHFLELLKLTLLGSPDDENGILKKHDVFLQTAALDQYEEITFASDENGQDLDIEQNPPETSTPIILDELTQDKDLLENTPERSANAAISLCPPAIKPDEFTDMLPHLHWYRKPFNVELDVCKNWLDLLLLILSEFPDRKMAIMIENGKIMASVSGFDYSATANEELNSNIALSIVLSGIGHVDNFSATIESLQWQYQPDVELLILINEEDKEISRLAEKMIRHRNPNVRVFRLENHPDTASAWNVGIEFASGKYIHFMDSGERRNVVDLLNSLSYLGTADWGVSVDGRKECAIIPTKESELEFLGELISHRCTASNLFLYKLEFLRKQSITFPPSARFHAKQIFNLVCAYFSKTIALLSDAQMQQYPTDRDALAPSRNTDPYKTIEQIEYLEKFWAVLKNELDNDKMNSWLDGYLSSTLKDLANWNSKDNTSVNGRYEITRRLTTILKKNESFSRSFINGLSALLPPKMQYKKMSLPESSHMPLIRQSKMSQRGSSWDLTVVGELDSSMLSSWRPTSDCGQVEQIAIVRSDENLKDTISALMALYPNLTVIELSPDASAGNALNMALKNACGEYITFLTKAECILPGGIQSILAQLGRAEEDIIRFGNRDVDQAGRIEKQFSFSAVGDGKALLGSMFEYNLPLSLNGTIFRTKYLKDKGLFFPINAIQDNEKSLFLLKALEDASARFFDMIFFEQRKMDKQAGVTGSEINILNMLYQYIDKYSTKWSEKAKNGVQKYMRQSLHEYWLPINEMLGLSNSLSATTDSFIKVAVDDYLNRIAVLD